LQGVYPFGGLFVNFGFILRAPATAAFWVEVSRRRLSMVQTTQIMHLYGQRAHFMPSKIESEEWIDC
jgi:hypothetical protein